MTPSSPPAPPSVAGRGRRPTTGPRSSTASPRSSRAAASSSRPSSAPPRASPPAKARTYVDAAIDRLVWYAGWADKITQVVGNANPVAGPYFNLSTPEPSGVIAVVAPRGALLGLVSVVAPLIITGNTVVVIASEEQPADRDHPRRGDGDQRPARRRGQRAHRLGGRDRPVAGLAHGRQRHRPHRHRGRGARDRRSRWPRPTTSSAYAVPPPTPTGSPSPASTG